jgi:hypothetical protein
LVLLAENRHQDEEKMHARLVRLNVETESGRPVLIVKARNFGPLRVLEITLAYCLESFSGRERTDLPGDEDPNEGIGPATVSVGEHPPKEAKFIA